MKEEQSLKSKEDREAAKLITSKAFKELVYFPSTGHLRKYEKLLLDATSKDNLQSLIFKEEVGKLKDSWYTEEFVNKQALKYANHVWPLWENRQEIKLKKPTDFWSRVKLFKDDSQVFFDTQTPSEKSAFRKEAIKKILALRKIDNRIGDSKEYAAAGIVVQGKDFYEKALKDLKEKKTTLDDYSDYEDEEAFAFFHYNQYSQGGLVLKNILNALNQEYTFKQLFK